MRVTLWPSAALVRFGILSLFFLTLVLSPLGCVAAYLIWGDMD